jgi:formamidopyrimidine-DNA glycosylase
MPELPEVETVRRTLQPILGRRVSALWTSGLPLRLGQAVDTRALRRATVGRCIEDVRRWGKFLLIDLQGGDRSVIVHLGMSGRLRVMLAGSPRPAHTHVEWALGGKPGLALRFSDPRRFGLVTLCTRGAERDHPALAGLGTDALTGRIDGALLHGAARGSKRSVKALLLDQRVLAGVGNIYASEALWHAGIRPTLPAGKLSRPRAEALAEAVGVVLRHALEHGGTSLRDFVDADGASGEHADYLWVYDRAGQPCPRCSKTVRRSVVQGRATFYCPSCQPR